MHGPCNKTFSAPNANILVCLALLGIGHTKKKKKKERKKRLLPKEAWIFNCPWPPGEVNYIRMLYRGSPADKENTKDSRKMKISVNQNFIIPHALTNS